MAVETIEHDFKRKVCEKVRLYPEGVDRYRVFTPFMFEDGDHLAVVLKRENERWVLSDEGNTYMHLTYDLDERDLRQGTRDKIITNALSAFSIDDRDGELVAKIPDDQYGDALYSFVQALLRIADVSYLSRERVRSTFLQDFNGFVQSKVPGTRLKFCWHDPERDPEANYVVDCRIDSPRKPLFVFALQNDDRVQTATITLLQFERWGIDCHSVGVFEDQEEVNRKVLARFSDVCEKQFSNLASNRDRISKYVTDLLGNGASGE